MTSAPASFKRSKVALILSAMMLISTTLPLASVFATNEAGELDDLVVIVHPRLGTVLGDEVAVSSTGNLFIFDFELHHADGSPYLVKEYMVDVNTIDGRLNPDPDPGNFPTLIWTDTFSSSSAIWRGVIRIPAADITFYTPPDPNGYNHELPFGGMTLTILATKDHNGNNLASAEGYFPAGQYSLAANHLGEDLGDWAAADRADEGFTPILLFNGQLSGLYQFNNPILNPGFEIGYESTGSPDDLDGFVPGATTGIPPWFLARNDRAHVHSTNYIQGSGGSSGSSSVVQYNHDDDGGGLYYGQFFFVPGASEVQPGASTPGPWCGSGSMRAEYDMRARDSSGIVTNYHGLSTLHWADSSLPSGEGQLTLGPAGGVPTDNVWRHYSINFGAAASDKQLNSFLFSFNLAAGDGSNLNVEFDNVRLVGAKQNCNLPAAATTYNDLTDGFSTFVLPAGALLNQGGNAVAQLVGLGGGETGYVFRLSAIDYRGIDPQVVDLDSTGYLHFQLLGGDFVAARFNHDPENVEFDAESTGPNASAFFQFTDIEGNLADDGLIVVPSDFVDQILTPWFSADMVFGPGDEYTDTFGSLAEPAGAYYSAARNNLMFTHLADSMDYAFTPMLFTSDVGGDMSYDVTARFDCPAMAVNVQCAADPDPDFNVTVSTDSPILETMTVQIVAPSLIGSANFSDGVLASGTIGTPGGNLSLTVASNAMENLSATGEMFVQAVVLPGTFTNGAETNLLQLDNFRPVANFTTTSLVNLTKGSVVTFTSTSTDSDGTIEHYEWRIEYLADPTPDADPAAPGLIRGGNQSSISLTIPDDGSFRATLNVTDNGGANDSKTLDFSAINLAPQISITGPAFARPNVTVPFTYTLADADGLLALTHSVNNGTGFVTKTTLPGVLPFTAFFATNGTKTVSVRATDDDGAITTKSFSLLVDSDLPTATIISEPAPNATDGWFTGPVSFLVNRTDPNVGPSSGLAGTTLVIASGAGSSTEFVTGKENFTREIAEDGSYLVTAASKDNAGNIGLTASTVIKIDTSKPTVTILTPTLGLDGSPLAGVFFTSEAVPVVVDANDPHSPVVKVEFFVDGGDAVGVDANATDGWSFSWIASGTGTHEIAVVATNAAGLREISDTITVLVV